MAARQVWPRTVQLATLLVFGAVLNALAIGLEQGLVLCVIASFLAVGRP